jgi:MFS family permease
VFGGWIGDRFGPRRALTVCAVIWACATLATGLVGSLAGMVVARAVLGLGEGATFPVATRAMASWIAPDRRGFAQGITHAAARLGNAGAPILVAAIMLLHGWRASFIVLGAISLAWAVIWGVYFRDAPETHRHSRPQDLEALPKPDPAAARQAPWGALIRRMWPVTITYFCYGWTLWLFLSWIPQYFKHSFALDLQHAAGFSSAVFCAGVLGDGLGGIVTDWLKRRTGSLTVARRAQVVICMLCAFLAMLPLAFVHRLDISVVCLSLGFFFAEMTIGPMWAIPMDIAPEHAGTASGLMNTGSALAASLSPVVAGFVIDLTGNWDLMFLGSMGLLLVGAVTAFWMRPDLPLRGGGAPPPSRRPAVARTASGFVGDVRSLRAHVARPVQLG